MGHVRRGDLVISTRIWFLVTVPVSVIPAFVLPAIFTSSPIWFLLIFIWASVAWFSNFCVVLACVISIKLLMAGHAARIVDAENTIVLKMTPFIDMVEAKDEDSDCKALIVLVDDTMTRLAGGMAVTKRCMATAVWSILASILIMFIAATWGLLEALQGSTVRGSDQGKNIRGAYLRIHFPELVLHFARFLLVLVSGGGQCSERPRAAPDVGRCDEGTPRRLCRRRSFAHDMHREKQSALDVLGSPRYANRHGSSTQRSRRFRTHRTNCNRTKFAVSCASNAPAGGRPSAAAPPRIRA